MIEAYPLQWPVGYPRTQLRKNSRFDQTLAAVRDYLKKEVKQIGGSGLVISTNIPVKQNGDLRADFGRFKMDDPGVAVYFTRNGVDVVLCCDTYIKVWENIYAIGRTLEALRQINRDGVSDFLNRTFTGFKALPETTATEAGIWETLGLQQPPASAEIVHACYKKKAKDCHPDRPGGSVEAFQHLNEAYRQALKFFPNHQ